MSELPGAAPLGAAPSPAIPIAPTVPTASSSAPDRAHHANIDRESRRRKAAKIVTILERRAPLKAARVLEIGTGAGIIAAVLAEAAGPDGAVESVDVVDVRVETDGYHYQRVDGTELPFSDHSFDFVVSNHVIEHTGEPAEQRHHLAETARVLRPGGVAYLAVPNRYGPIEPHFKLPLLSWLPARLADRYVRAAARGTHYDCRPLTRRELRTMARAAGLLVDECTLEATRLVRDLEAGPLARKVLGAPDAVLRVGLPVIPTFVFLLRRNDSPTA